MSYTRVLFSTAVVAFASVAAVSEASAQLINEVRVGVLDHDTDLVGSSKEGGTDIGVEVLSPPIESLRIIGRPRAVFGAQVNTDGYTNMIYGGLLAQWDFAHGVIQPEDAFFLEGSVGGALHDGKTDVRGTPEEAEWKSHGSHLVFRTGFGAGYRFNEQWSVTASFSHISNADIELPNEGSNDVGLRLGMKF